MPHIEARLILPTEPSRGSHLQAVHYQVELVKLERLLVETFGGYTQTEGIGAWRAPQGSIVRERVRIYLFAYDRYDHDQSEAMERLPADVRKSFDQEAVYLSRTELKGQPVHLAPWEGNE